MAYQEHVYRNSINFHDKTYISKDRQQKQYTQYYIEDFSQKQRVCLLACCFKVRSRIFCSYGAVNIDSEFLQNPGLVCFAPKAFQQGGIFIDSELLQNRPSTFCRGIFIVPHLLHVTRDLGFAVSSKRPPQCLITFYDKQGLLHRDLLLH